MRTMPRRAAFLSLACALLAVCTLASATPAAAQIRASELGTVSQTVDGTKIIVEYSRPRARGRTVLFGTRVVQWNEVWTPGANFATTLSVNKDVTLSGAKVPKGQYSVWMVVREKGDWTMVLDPRVRLFHMAHPDSTAAQIRFPIKVEQSTPAVDALTWSFPDVRSGGATMHMQWGTYRAIVDVGVQPSLTYTLPSTESTQYIGRYAGREADDSAPKTPWNMVVLYEEGMLKAEFDPADTYMNRFVLIRLAPDLFTAGLYQKGEIVGNGEVYEVLRPDMMITFKRTDGKIVGFDVRNGDDKLDFKAVRTP